MQLIGGGERKFELCILTLKSMFLHLHLNFRTAGNTKLINTSNDIMSHVIREPPCHVLRLAERTGYLKRKEKLQLHAKFPQ